ncbi:hypothetical protein CANINC_004222 [Pichia inconspicua]|uniref:Pre-mRNA-splicing factor SLU7 n=1 Tax=Pichia inconspicua TaxID=52247 RepID=A0A4T0WX10_9ASCO|nr:hypothetical protein CANINC_004222 [[Candida] inconspicua]
MSNKQPSNKKTYVDSETGRKVNDYIPSFISNKPWYFNENDKTLQVDKNARKRKSNDEMFKEIADKSSDRLKHQRINDKPFTNTPTPGKGIQDILEEVQDSTTSVPPARKIWLRKGLCENCGGKHKKVDCLEKPHTEKFKSKQNTVSKVVFTKKDTEDWDVKRDRWRDVDIDEEYGGIVSNLKKKENSIIKNPLEIQEKDGNIVSRDISDKPRYLEVIKTGEELRYNPKSRVYKDLKEGYLNERGQFIPYLTGEAAEFEQLKKFARTKNESKIIPIVSPTTTMLKLKEKKKSDELRSSQIAKKLHDRYT